MSGVGPFDLLWADEGPEARVVETHLSVLFFYRYQVLKIRRPVAYGFVDFTDPERRREDCEREVILNRRLAPDVYLGTATLSMDGRPVEHAVVMHRLPSRYNLADLLRRGAPIDQEIRAIAGELARFHQHASRSAQISAAGSATAQWQRWQATEEELGRFVGPLVDPAAYRELTALAGRYLRGRSPLFDQRMDEGAVCDGHGDLQASDIFCLPDGPRILDCLEFDDTLRHGDVLADVAFLATDLELVGAPAAARRLLDEYRRQSGVRPPPSLVHFYIAARAHVRLLVECLRSEQGLSPAAMGAPGVLDVALAHLRAAQPVAILVGGLPGAGKTTLASWIAAELEADLISTDQLRRGGGRSLTTPGALDANRYSDTARARVYGQLCDAARARLSMGRSVVLDGTWTSAGMRSLALTTARAASAGTVELRCECAPAERATRLGARQRAGTDKSEATAEVADLLEASQDPWPGATVIDTSGPAEGARLAAMDAIARTLRLA